MYQIINKQSAGTQVYSINSVDSFGELTEKIAIEYRGARAPSSEEKEKDLLFSLITPHHKNVQIKDIFGNLNNREDIAKAEHKAAAKFVSHFVDSLNSPKDEIVAPEEPIYMFTQRNNVDTFAAGKSYLYVGKTSLNEDKTLFLGEIFIPNGGKILDITANAKDRDKVLHAIKQTIAEMSDPKLDMSHIFGPDSDEPEQD